MVVAEPRRGGLGRARDGGDDEDEGEGGERAVAASGRAGDELVALVPPNYGRATVEKIAVNAVMAGCRPEYLPVVLAAIDAVCDEAFDLHGVSARSEEHTSELQSQFH